MTNKPPLLENGIFVRNFQSRADMFNHLFVQQCSVHVNDSVLPNFISRCNLFLANIDNRKKMINKPPLLENGIFVRNFQSRADMFNHLFVQQCSVHVNDSVLPNFITRCNLFLANIDIDPDKVLKIIRSLDCNKAHGWDNFSIATIKICDVEVVKPLCLIYNQCLASRTFPEIWEKGVLYQSTKKRVDN